MKTPNDAARRMEAFQAKLAARQAELYEMGIQIVPPPPACPVCGDLGVIRYDVPVDDSRFGKLFPCPNPGCRTAVGNRHQSWEKRFKLSGLPELFRDFTFDSWNATVSPSEREGKRLALMACQLFVDSAQHTFTLNQAISLVDKRRMTPQYDRPKNSLMLFGPVGTGKTGLMAAVVNALMAQGESVLCIRANDLIKDIQNGYNRDSQYSAAQVQDTYQTAPVLLLDEFNMAATDNRMEIFESIIRYRYGRQMPTLMTANVDQAGFLKMWGERTADVISAMAHWVEVGGQKLRKTALEAVSM